MKRNGLGPNQKRILELLTAYPNSTVMEIVKLLYSGQDIKYGGKQYASTCRSFHKLQERGLLERVDGQSIKWHVKPKSP